VCARIERCFARGDRTAHVTLRGREYTIDFEKGEQRAAGRPGGRPCFRKVVDVAASRDGTPYAGGEFFASSPYVGDAAGTHFSPQEDGEEEAYVSTHFPLQEDEEEGQQHESNGGGGGGSEGATPCKWHGTLTGCREPRCKFAHVGPSGGAQSRPSATGGGRGSGRTERPEHGNTECRFGGGCHDLSEAHRRRFSHPHVATHASGRYGACKFGTRCTNTEAKHQFNYSHA
jgi:hypothetical protein